MMIIGLTGGVGSGKSSVAQEFQKLGVDVIDTDIIAHALTCPHTDAFQAIVKRFPCVLTASKVLDRHQLRSIILTSESERHWLESLLHPLIWEEAEKQCQLSCSPYCMLVVPLLLETNSMGRVGRVLVVDTEPELQFQRAQHRKGWTREQVSCIMQIQANREERLAVADDVILNVGSLEEMAERVRELHEGYLSLRA